MRAVVWLREFLAGRTQRVRVGGKVSKEVKVTSGVPQGSVLGALKFLVYVNDIWRNIDSNIWLFADECVINRKITNKNDTRNLQVLDTLGDWAVQTGMKINPGKIKAIRFPSARVKNPLGYCLGDQNIPEAGNCKYLGIMWRSNLNWVDQVNYTVQKAWKALRFVMLVLKRENRNTKSLAYKSLVRPVLEYGSSCWDPLIQGQINASYLVQKKAVQFTNNTKDCDWQTLAQRRTIARLCALFKAYSGEGARKAIRDRLRRPYYLSRVDHVRKITDRKQRTDIGKYSFVNRTIKYWNQLIAKTLGLSLLNLRFLETELGKQL